MAPAILGVMTTIADELRQRTFRYALRVLFFCRKLPDTVEGREIAKQLLRAGMGHIVQLLVMLSRPLRC